MSIPVIRSSGSVSGAGTDGQGRNNLVIAETVTLTDVNPANSEASYTWTLLDRPHGSVAVLVPSGAQVTFIPDLLGSYFVKCLVNGTASASEVYAVPLPNTGARIPAFQESLEYNQGGNTTGWHEALRGFMLDVDEQLEGASTDEKVKVDANDTSTGYLDAKITVSSGLSKTIQNVNHDENILLANTKPGHVIQESGTVLTTRDSLNFGAGLVAADDSENSATKVDLETLSPSPAGTYAYPSSVVVDSKGRVSSAVGGSASTDEKVKISSGDTTAGRLDAKLVAGTNITITKLNPGVDEQLSISAAGGTDAHDVKVSSDDSTPSTLDGKIVAGTNVTLTVLNPGANEQISIAASGGTDAHDVKVSSDDSTPSTLDGKVVAGTNVTLTVLNPGANEQISISASGGASLTRRVAPDADDLIVLPFDEAPGATTFANSGTAGGTFGVDGTVVAGSAGLFQCGAYIVSSSSRIRGAASVEPSLALTVSCWVTLSSYWGSGWSLITAKMRNVSGTWPWWSTMIFGYNDSTLRFYVYPADGASTITVSQYLLKLYEWNHLALTYSSTLAKFCAYINGKLVGSIDPCPTGVIQYGNHNDWVVGCPTGLSGQGCSTTWVDDFRVSQVARSTAYLLDMYKRGLGRTDNVTG